MWTTAVQWYWTKLSNYHAWNNSLCLSVFPAQLGNILLHNPQVAWKLLQQVVPAQKLEKSRPTHFPSVLHFHLQVCYMVITSLGWLTCLTSLSQLLLVLRLTCLPDLPGCVCVSDIKEVYSECVCACFNFRLAILSAMWVSCLHCQAVQGSTCSEEWCVVWVHWTSTRMLMWAPLIFPRWLTPPLPFIRQHACFSCSNEHCSSHDETLIRLHVPGASEAATVRGGGEEMCYCCGTQLLEKITFRTLAGQLETLTYVCLCIINKQLCFFSQTNCTFILYLTKLCTCASRHGNLEDISLWVWSYEMSCVGVSEWEDITQSLDYRPLN